jgi:branched-chain amino acid transport system substrate-binding protein
VGISPATWGRGQPATRSVRGTRHETRGSLAGGRRQHFGSFKEADDAARAYFDCVNANGGIHGRPISYHDEDDQTQLDVAAQAAKKLIADEGVYAMVGNASIIECIPNANYYLKENVLEVGVGIPPQCYQSKNIAEVNARPRQSGIAGVDYARRVLGAKSVACTIPKFPGSDWSCGGIEEWARNTASRSRASIPIRFLPTSLRWSCNSWRPARTP